MDEKRLISICGSCYNEGGNIEELIHRIQAVMAKETYQYEIIIADNASIDDTEVILRRLASVDSRIKVILNQRNYGPRLSPKNALKHCNGDAVILISTDLQDPPELIPSFLRAWESGYEMVYGQKNSSEVGKMDYRFRKLYYDILDFFSPYHLYHHVSGICLNSKEVLRELLQLDEDASWSLVLPEMGRPIKLIPYAPQQRKKGHSSYNLWRYLDHAINSLIDSSTIPLRLATILGICISFICFLVGIIYLVLKICHWNDFSAGSAPLTIMMCFLGGVELSFIGLVGEYVGSVLRKVTKHLPVKERELINFDS